jgi:pyruvate dehydrogenase E2 component (dihydrolipoamide acetyltransferase)
MPRQGNTVESCVIQEWKVKEGDTVNAGTSVCVVETDKATFDVPAGADGTILKLLHPGGDDVPVLQPIAVIGTPGEDWSAALETGFREDQRKGTGMQKNTQTVDSPSPNIHAAMPPGDANAASAVSPRARKLAAKEGILPAMPGSGPGGRIIEQDIAAALANRSPMTAAAKAIAVAGLTAPRAGTGLGGRITAADMVFAGMGSASTIQDKGTETHITGVRKLIAGRMLASLLESAQFTLNAGASAVRLQELRRILKANNDQELSKITINDLILYTVSRVLPSYPYMNAHKIGEVIKTYEGVHLGMAVDTDRGLMVPVIRNAGTLSLRQIAAEAKRLAAACQSGSIMPDELSGSTFSVSNLGSFGVASFTPVLNIPEVAILGICGIKLKPVEDISGECAFAYEPHIGFSLTINHQVVDGAPAARFLKALCQAVADIELTLAPD